MDNFGHQLNDIKPLSCAHTTKEGNPKKEQGELANKNTSKARREEITKDDWERTEDQICL